MHKRRSVLSVLIGIGCLAGLSQCADDLESNQDSGALADAFVQRNDGLDVDATISYDSVTPTDAGPIVDASPPLPPDAAKPPIDSAIPTDHGLTIDATLPPDSTLPPDTAMLSVDSGVPVDMALAADAAVPQDKTNLICATGKNLLSHAPLDDNAYLSISPLGNVNPPDHTFPTAHTYMGLADPSTAKDVYAAADATITQISVSTTASSISISLQVCKDVHFYHDHMTTLSTAILAHLVPANECQWTHKPAGMTPYCLKINVKAGEVIGTIGGPGWDGSAALDFGMRDKREPPIPFINTSAVFNPELAYTTCPYDYYPAGPVRTHFEDKLKVERTVTPLCNTIDHDVASTAQGIWYLSGDPYFSEFSGMSLVPANSGVGWGVISIGAPPFGPNDLYFQLGTSGQIRTAFTALTSDSHTYCYDQLRSMTSTTNGMAIPGHVFLTMPNATTMNVQYVGTGTCPANPDSFTFTNPVAYSR